MNSAAFIYKSGLRRKAAVLVLLLSLLAGLSVSADQATSTSFGVRDTAVGALGGRSTSTSFGADQSSGPIDTAAASSTSFTILSGPLAFDAFTPASKDWRWYGDDVNETPVSALAPQNTAPVNIDDSEVIKLRMVIREVSGIGGNDVKFGLQFSETSDFSSGATNVSEIGSCNGVSQWCYADGGGTDGVAISTTTLTSTDPCPSGCGTHNESGVTTSTFDHAANASVEYEFTLKHSGAHLGATYFFRAFYVGGETAVPLDGSSAYPSLITAGSRLSFTVSGLTSGTSTEGVTTDITTTPTTIPFGTLAFNSDKIAAQRLTVTTNASQGYQIFVLEDQNPMNGRSDTIPDITATNETPAGWSAACGSSLSGCYGYHAGDDTLASLSVRFAPNDSYAKLESVMKEVAYSSLPVENRSTDIVFRALARVNQPSGDYENSITYIVVPVY